MKKIFAVYLSVLCAFPILVRGNVPCSTYNNNRANCLAKGGCWFDSFVSPTVCDACYNDQYNPQQQNCNDEDNDNCENSCQSVPFGSYKNDAGTGYLACPTNNIISAGDTDVMYIGNCSCTANTQLIKTSPNSVDQYYCGQCGLGLQPSTNNGVATCPTCPDGSNNVHGELVSGTRLECSCPTNDGYWDSSTQQCACLNNKILTRLSSGEWVCSSCDATKHETFNNGECVCQQGYYRPTNSTAACTKCPDFASTDDVNSHSINDCHCRSDYGQYPADSSTVPGDFVCNKCDDNATVDSSSVQCKCDENYYGNGLQNSCVKCPAGTTKSAGGSVNHPTTQSACHFTSGATKFCIQSTVRTTDNDGYVCFTPTNVTYTY